MRFRLGNFNPIFQQAFYNPQIIQVLNKLISGNDHLAILDEEYKMPITEPSRKKKHDKKKNKTQKSAKAKGIDITNISSVRGSALYQIPVPEKLETKTYGACVEFLSSRVRTLCLTSLRMP